ncbi:hypothetical protein ACFL5O_12075, partial [Myxococcota bacterium]
MLRSLRMGRDDEWRPRCLAVGRIGRIGKDATPDLQRVGGSRLDVTLIAYPSHGLGQQRGFVL